MELTGFEEGSLPQLGGVVYCLLVGHTTVTSYNSNLGEFLQTFTWKHSVHVGGVFFPATFFSHNRMV